MLRVGLTGGLGSGKSTVAARLRSLGAQVMEADELGRALMEPGQPVYAAIVQHFGSQVLAPDQRLDRAALARIAFDGGRLDELNAIVHPAVIEAQQKWMEGVFAREQSAVAVVESALIFEVERDARERGESEGALADWRRRFDRVVVVTAAEQTRVARYVARITGGAWDEGVAEDARARMKRQMTDAEKTARADFVLTNDGAPDALLAQTDAIWEKLKAESASGKGSGAQMEC